MTASKPVSRHQGRGSGTSRTSPARLAQAQRAVRALELRAGGATFAAIGEDLGIGAAGAFKLVERALRYALQEPAEAVRQIEAQRLDMLWRRLQPKIRKGDLKAIEVALKVMARRAALLGLDAPVQVQAPDGTPVRFVVEIPAPAASVAEWAAQAGGVIDVEPARPELGTTTPDPGLTHGGEQ
jgi:hypothetical protein